MSKQFIARLYVPEHIKNYYFLNDSVQEQFTRIFKLVLSERLERIKEKDLVEKKTDYRNYIEIKLPIDDSQRTSIQRVNVGVTFEEHFRSALAFSFREDLRKSITYQRQAGYKVKHAINNFMREHNLLNLDEFDEQTCLDQYTQARKEYDHKTRFRKIQDNGI